VDNSIVRFCACLTAAAVLAAACGGGSSSSSNATSAPAATTAAMGGTMAGGGSMMGHMPTGTPAAVPSTLKCTGAIVWINMKTKSYHMAGDPFYGRTRSGQYMCQSDADAKGYHMAGSGGMHSHMSGGAATTPAPAST
jgi:hypothetical protein